MMAVGHHHIVPLLYQQRHAMTRDVHSPTRQQIEEAGGEVGAAAGEEAVQRPDLPSRLIPLISF